MLGDLSRLYESNGDPGCISNGWGDAGGKSYGMYQLASRMGSVNSYLGWCKRAGYWFADYLMEHEVGSAGFDTAWSYLANSEIVQTLRIVNMTISSMHIMTRLSVH